MFPDEPSSFPELSIVCGKCSIDVQVPPGLNALDVEWMHQWECPVAIAELEAEPT